MSREKEIWTARAQSFSVGDSNKSRAQIHVWLDREPDRKIYVVIDDTATAIRIANMLWEWADRDQEEPPI